MQNRTVHKRTYRKNEGQLFKNFEVLFAQKTEELSKKEVLPVYTVKPANFFRSIQLPSSSVINNS